MTQTTLPPLRPQPAPVKDKPVSREKSRSGDRPASGRPDPPPPRDYPPRAASHRRSQWKRIALLVFCMMIMCMGVGAGIAISFLNHYLDQLPTIPYLEDYRPWMPSRIFAGDESHQLVADFFSPRQNREVVPLSEIPENLINAVLGMEDFDFYEHPGISPRGFLRAAYVDLRTRSLQQGGSTLTMQLAEDLIVNKHVPYDIPDMGLKSFQQKLWEILLALQIEKRYTKNEILEIYLNQVFLGGNIYGVARAAESYFGKEVSELSLKECALFAGMLQRPNAYSPVRNPEAAQRRTELVLRVMRNRGLITPEQYRQAVEEPFQLNTKAARRSQVALYPYFTWGINRQFQDRVITMPNGQPIEIYGQGVDVESTLHPRIQEIAEECLRRGIIQHEHRRRPMGGRDWGRPGYKGVNRSGPSRLVPGQEYDAKILANYDPAEGAIPVTVPNVQDGKGPFTVPVEPGETWLDDFDVLHKDYFVRVKAVQEGDKIQLRLAEDRYVQGALIALRPSTGEVVCQVGGYDYYDEKNSGQFIRTLQATMLQPGSAFKPLLYAAALAEPKKKWTVVSTLLDIEKEYWTNWVPKNYYDRYYGRVTMLYSLTHSLNAATVWLLSNYKGTRASGVESLRRFCREVFDFPVNDSNLSVALGTSGCTPYQLAQAYAVLANQGNFVKIHMVNKVYQRQDSRQNYPFVLYEFKPSANGQPRLSPEVAYLVTYMLRNVVEQGTAKDLKDAPFVCYGKTGTTDDCTYAWFAGYTKDFLCVVYLGYDDPKRSLGVKMTGSTTALPIWKEFMTRVHEIHPEWFGEIEPPPGINFRTLCRDSYKIATALCPRKEKYPFAEGTGPVDRCAIHVQDAVPASFTETSAPALAPGEPVLKPAEWNYEARTSLRSPNY
ncbi:MAG TPA: transglycosylase domain-containing protein [bacterium]|nr:transglycosylase domain-containing protein [bacterium]